ncbi:hypothetical protein [Mesorhizobium mediterraneum]|uniref:hypothetical protein n=1 Tax=Mesorhizobium mediterraneum TaxID=43617 RepID=UPI00177C5D54|nr:hypothetical protein [Mesorhizobium mediterraneum]
MSEASEIVAKIEAKATELETLRADLLGRFGITMPADNGAAEKRRLAVVAIALTTATLFVVGALVLWAVAPTSWLSGTTGWIGKAAIMLASTALIIAAALAWPDRFDKSWIQLDKIVSSSGFYFFAGLALLLYSIHTTNSLVHPSLTFLLAMLGMAILLFGTGSQAVGSIATAGARQLDPSEVGERDPAAVGAAGDTDLKRVEAAALETVKAIESAEALPSDAEKAAALPGLKTAAEEVAKRAGEVVVVAPQRTAPPGWSPFAANAAIAGGAAVLTALFGYGVINYRTEIKDVFGFYDRYVIMRIETCAAFEPTCVSKEGDDEGTPLPAFALSDYETQAELINGSPLYTIKSGNELQIIIFSEAIAQNMPIRIKLTRHAESAEIGPEIDRDINLTISPRSFETLRKYYSSGDAADIENAPKACVQSRGSDRVDCALVWIDSGNRGGQLHTVLYSLNFLNENAAVAGGKVNHVDVAFE